jgi:golgi SNAP receptor complex member 2
MDRMIYQGELTLDHIKKQTYTLKTVKNKMLNIANSLGLSNTLIRMIERRSDSDRYVLYGGIVITCIIMFLTIKYLAG